MTIAYWCVLVAGLLPYVATIIAKSDSRYNNANPRLWLSNQSGFRARANAAQQNGFETFPLFAVAVIIASVNHAPQNQINILAILFVAFRILYLFCYIFDKASMRSFIWFLGLLSSMVIFISPIW